jgi:hypothetical protein
VAVKEDEDDDGECIGASRMEQPIEGWGNNVKKIAACLTDLILGMHLGQFWILNLVKVFNCQSVQVKNVLSGFLALRLGRV